MLRERSYQNLEREFALTLRKLREKAGLTQEELAARCGIHRTYVSQLERALKTPTIRLLWQICVPLNITPADFISLVEKSVPTVQDGEE